MGNQKVPRMVILHNNGRTYSNLSRTLVHTYTLAPSNLPLLEKPVESLFWNFLDFSHHIQFDVLHSCEHVPLKPIFRVQNNQKSLGAWSGEYGGWVMTEMLSSLRNCCTTSDVWLGALCWAETTVPATWCTSSSDLRNLQVEMIRNTVRTHGAPNRWY
jgi:hypothetical protein